MQLDTTYGPLSPHIYANTRFHIDWQIAYSGGKAEPRQIKEDIAEIKTCENVILDAPLEIKFTINRSEYSGLRVNVRMTSQNIVGSIRYEARNGELTPAAQKRLASDMDDIVTAWMIQNIKAIRTERIASYTKATLDTLDAVMVNCRKAQNALEVLV